MCVSSPFPKHNGGFTGTFYDDVLSNISRGGPKDCDVSIYD